MYEYLTNIINKELKKRRGLITERHIEEILIGLIYILYLSSKKEFKTKIKNLLEEDNIKLFYDYLRKEHDYYNYYFQYIDIKKLLKIIKGQNYRELLDEVLQNKKDQDVERLEIFKKKTDRILYLNTSDSLENYDYTNKNVTYLKQTLDNNYISSYSKYIVLDKMLNLKRNYYDHFKDLNLNDYDIIIINDTEPVYKYSANKENIINELEQNFYHNNFYTGKIILKTSYNKISRFKYYSLIRSHLNKVILHAYVKNTTVYMEFLPANNKSISLILLDEELANDNNKLQKIIESNRNKKGTLIKVTPEDIRNNSYRISFKMYETENIEKIKEINDIVDENTSLTKKLEGLNDTIEAEVNKLLERTGG